VYAKLFRQMYDGTLATAGPWEALVTFQQLLILANEIGEVDMTAGAIARITTIPRDVIERGITALMAPDPDSRTPTEEGRRIVLLSEGRTWGWRIVNHANYRQIRSQEDRREYHRNYYHTVRKPAAAELLSSTPTQHPSTLQPPATHTDTDTEADTEAIKKERARSRSAPFPCPDGVDPQVWADWLALRKAKKAPVTQTVVEGALAESAKARLSLDAFLRIWCARGSQGMQADWIKSAERSAATTGETAWQRSQRERVAEMTGGRASRKAPQPQGEIVDATPTTARRLG